MDIILQRYSGKIDSQSIMSTVEDIKAEYLDDGITKEDIPPVIARLMMETYKFKQLPGPQKKKLVIQILNHLIEQIDEGEKDSEFETILKTMVPPIIDGFATMIKNKKNLMKCIPCLSKGE